MPMKLPPSGLFAAAPNRPMPPLNALPPEFANRIDPTELPLPQPPALHEDVQPVRFDVDPLAQVAWVPVQIYAPGDETPTAVDWNEPFVTRFAAAFACPAANIIPTTKAAPSSRPKPRLNPVIDIVIYPLRLDSLYAALYRCFHA